MRKARWRWRLALLPAVLPLVLGGCATAPQRPSDPTSATVAPPSGAPAAPLLPGEVVASSSGDGWWRVSVRSTDTARDYGRARALLVDGGFTLTKDREGTGGGDGQACRPDLCVGFFSGGGAVDYEVFRPATTGAP